MSTSLDNLIGMRTQLECILQHAPRFGSLIDRPPILDSHTHATSTANPRSDSNQPITNKNSAANTSGIPGLKAFQEYVRRDVEQIDLFIKRQAKCELDSPCPSFPTNAPYLIAVWNELIRAPQPVIAIDKMVKASQSHAKAKKHVGVKVDVVAEKGMCWIRVNTIKNSRLLAEFREHDSYLTSDEEEETSECSLSYHSLNPGKDELRNSIIDMGHSLLSAAATEAAGKSFQPRITLRLTRLRLNNHHLEQLRELGLKTIGDVLDDRDDIDERIPHSIKELLSKGIEVVLGEHEYLIPEALLNPSLHKESKLVPSLQINLDLSTVIALVSDITHAPLPVSKEEAYARFIPTPAEKARLQSRRLQQRAILANAKGARSGRGGQSPTERKHGQDKNRLKIDDNARSDVDDGDSSHSRVLASQAVREMTTGLLDEISSLMRQSRSLNNSALGRFWVSKEVQNRCLHIVNKIGGPHERRRAAALFFRANKRESRPRNSLLGHEFLSEEDAVEAYWHGSRHSGATLPSLVPLRIIGEDDPSASETGASLVPDATPNFWNTLNGVCTRLLDSGIVANPRNSLAPLPVSSHSNDFATEITRASVTSANPRLTVHTVETLAHGSDPRRRWTTLTANRASVREILRECDRESTTQHHVQSSFPLLSEHSATQVSQGESKVKVAAIWVLEPRSLAEGMRSDFLDER